RSGGSSSVPASTPHADSCAPATRHPTAGADSGHANRRARPERARAVNRRELSTCSQNPNCTGPEYTADTVTSMNIATATRPSYDELLEFLRPRHLAILLTHKRSGGPQLSPV